MLSKSWLIKFIALSTGILVAMSGLIYLYDPLCYYRMPENRLYVSNVYYSLPGVIRHGRYNSVVLGSSMAQNFMKSTFYEHLKLDIIMLTYGGISTEIMKQLWVNVSKSMKAKVAFIGIDQYLFSGASEANASFPLHLYDSVAVNDYRYLLIRQLNIGLILHTV